MPKSPLILVVEDDAQLRTVTSAVLSFEGYSVLEAGNGAEALGLLAAGRIPSLILLDLMMPVMNGFELLAAIRRYDDLRSIPVIVLSAFADGIAPPPGLEYLRKPVELDELLRCVRHACSPVSAAQEAAG